MNLTLHFTLEELTFTDHREFDNTPNEQELENLKRLSLFLEEVKKLLGGKAIMVNSAFRSEQVNAAVGSKDTSQHRRGCAADIRVPNMTPDEVVQAIINSDLQYALVILQIRIDNCLHYFIWRHIRHTKIAGTPKSML